MTSRPLASIPTGAPGKATRLEGRLIRMPSWIVNRRASGHLRRQQNLRSTESFLSILPDLEWLRGWLWPLKQFSDPGDEKLGLLDRLRSPLRRHVRTRAGFIIGNRLEIVGRAKEIPQLVIKACIAAYQPVKFCPHPLWVFTARPVLSEISA
jgi:hypothetical protein